MFYIILTKRKLLIVTCNLKLTNVSTYQREFIIIITIISFVLKNDTIVDNLQLFNYNLGLSAS